MTALSNRPRSSSAIEGADAVSSCTGARPSRSFRRTALGLTRPRTDHLAALDGLRAVAVVAVIAYHLGHLDGGFLGVDVFFVLSGFLITRLLLAEREGSGRVDLRAFWGRRLRRLLPPLLVVLSAVAVGARLWLPSWRLSEIRVDAFAALAYVANWRFVQSGQSYFAQGVDPSPLRHTWSLGVEEQFYLVWPLLVLVAVRFAPGAVRGVALVGSGVLAIVSGAWMAWAAGGSLELTRIYYGTDTRIFAMCVGALVAAFWDPWREWTRSTDRGRRSGRMVTVAANVALVGIVCLFVVGSDTDPAFYRWGFQLAAVLAAVAVAGISLGHGRAATILSSDVARWVGRRSYGMYLWSWPVQIFARHRLAASAGWGLDLAIVATAVGAAALSFRFVEQPILARRPLLPFLDRSRRRPPARRERAPEAADVTGSTSLLGVLRPVSAVVGVVALLMVTTIGAPGSPTVFAVTDDQARDVALRDTGFAGSADGAGSNEDAAGDTSPSSTSVADEVGSGGGADGSLPGTFDPNGPARSVVALDPGPAPPFDPHDPLLVTSYDGDPAAVHGRPLRVVLIGDSVAWTLGWELGEGLDPGVLVSNRAIIGCGMMPIDSGWGVGDSAMEPYGELCEHQAEAEGRGFADDADVILIWMGAWEVFDHEWQGEELKVGSPRYAEVLEDRIQQRIDRARDIGVPVVMPVVPCMGEVPLGRFPGTRRDEGRVRWVNERVVTAALRNPGWVRLIDPTPRLCDDDGQPRHATPDGVEIRPDGVHFETESALWLWNTWLAGSLASALAPSS